MKMYIENLLKRADLKSIEYFLRYGGANLSEKSDKPSAEQLRNAENNIADTLFSIISDEHKHDEIMSRIFEQVEVFENISFELGFLAGAKIAIQAFDKLYDI